MTHKESFNKKYASTKEQHILVHCKTKELAKEFLQEAHDAKYQWISSTPANKKDFWYAYEEDTVYIVLPSPVSIDDHNYHSALYYGGINEDRFKKSAFSNKRVVEYKGKGA